ncbi:hypothetical protein, partial [Streptomyces sp. 8K308]|uniref:hypothetical protein n=1 Tax=Streptomyces sp. 8K308 TaxID=2530388 RepID=UPI0014049827
STTPPTVGARLESALRTSFDGEVAFDDYTRHLFSRDASTYAITPLRTSLDWLPHARRAGDLDA